MPALNSPPPPAYAIDTRAARRNADRAAPGYAAAARLEQEIGLRMLERLDYVKLAPRRILDAGCGPSPQAAQLTARYPEAQLLALDFSLPMLRAGRPPGGLSGGLPGWLGRLYRRLTRAPAPVPLCADFARIPLAARSCSLLWLNMSLHWASDPAAAIAEFHRVLDLDGLLMFSTLGPDTLRQLRAAFAPAQAAAHVHAFIDMHDLGDMLVAAGFAAPVMDAETLTLTYPGVEGLFADLRGSGQACALASRARGLMGARKWRSVRSALQSGMREARLPVTIEVVYGHAWKGAPRRTPEGHAVVKLTGRGGRQR